eukprot:COSAG02_NODE_1159_length_14178_cov_12.360679_1_plen_764_part_10
MKVATSPLDRLHVGELLIVYHSLCGAEHVPDKPGLVGVEAKLTAAFERLAPSLDVTPQENQAIRRSFGELAQGGDFRLAWVRLNAALEGCRATDSAAPQPQNSVLQAPLVAYNRVRRSKSCFGAWLRYFWSRRAGPCAAAVDAVSDRSGWASGYCGHTKAVGGAVSLAELAEDPICSSPIACSCMLVFVGLGLAAAERRAHQLPIAATSQLRAGWMTALIRGRYKAIVLAVWKRFTNGRQLQCANAMALVEEVGTACSGQDAFFAWNLWAWRKARKRWSTPLATRHARGLALARRFKQWTCKTRLGRRAAAAQEQHLNRQQGLTGFEQRDRHGRPVHRVSKGCTAADSHLTAARVRFKLDTVSDAAEMPAVDGVRPDDEVLQPSPTETASSSEFLDVQEDEPLHPDIARHMHDAAGISERIQLEQAWAIRAEQKVRQLVEASRQVLSDMVGGGLDTTDGHADLEISEAVYSQSPAAKNQNAQALGELAPMAYLMPYTAISAVAGGNADGGVGSSEHRSAESQASCGSTREPATNVPANLPGQPYTTRATRSRDKEPNLGTTTTAGSDAIRQMRVEHALLLAKILEIQAAAAEQGEDLVSTLQAEQTELMTVLKRETEPEAEQQQPDSTVQQGELTPEPTPGPEPQPQLEPDQEGDREVKEEPEGQTEPKKISTDIASREDKWQKQRESVERLLSFPVAGWANNAGTKRERSPAEKAKLAAVAARKLKQRFGSGPASIAAEANAASAWMAAVGAEKQAAMHSAAA